MHLQRVFAPSAYRQAKRRALAFAALRFPSCSSSAAQLAELRRRHPAGFAHDEAGLSLPSHFCCNIAWAPPSTLPSPQYERVILPSLTASFFGCSPCSPTFLRLLQRSFGGTCSKRTQLTFAAGGSCSLLQSWCFGCCVSVNPNLTYV